MRPRLPTAVRARQQVVIAAALRCLASARALVDRGIATGNGAHRNTAELTRLADERRHLALEVVAAEEEARRRSPRISMTVRCRPCLPQSRIWPKQALGAPG